MTEQEARDFFINVKGKKIRWSSWGDETYFVPSTFIRENGYNIMKGSVFYHPDYEYAATAPMNVVEGFSDYNTVGNNCWELFENLEDFDFDQPVGENK